MIDLVNNVMLNLINYVESPISATHKKLTYYIAYSDGNRNLVQGDDTLKKDVMLNSIQHRTNSLRTAWLTQMRS
ncbi:hypothetical protein Y10_02440 [Neptunitalea sp. Y10]|uniref:Uncharacterized protein n=1 Tax=Neptunitalea lumnitzerae TaxID=2965509 RepID=A0ABQ5MEY2_9FLAO|nr:hypothetical protein Y10_02440 [Neptunitalea sp. Y10]